MTSSDPAAPASGIVVTTGYRPSADRAARAAMIAARFTAPLLPRTAGFDAVFARSEGASLLYVVGRDHDEVRDREGRNCFVQEGLLPSKLGDGAQHPFIRAVGVDTKSVLDATLGLANDALHVACALRCSVTGIEGSPLIHALLEDGLARFRRDYDAHIELVHGDALTVLAAMPTGAVDVVTLDPMMSLARKSAPSFALLRSLAVTERASPELLGEAARVARRRVVFKLGKGAPLPPSPIAFTRHERGAHVVYWIHDVT